jgi:hypothetical protein
LAIDLSGRLVFHIENELDGQANLVSLNPVPIGKFIHVAGTLDDATGKQKLFIDRVEIASQVTKIRPFGALSHDLNPGIGIGNIQSAALSESFSGIIDETRISDISETIELSPTSAADCLFNWAETNYAVLFSPAGAATQTLPPYTYRYYKNTNAYVGVSSANNDVYYLGPDGNLRDVGNLSGWLTQAKCQ